MGRQVSPTDIAAELQRLKPQQWTRRDAHRVLALWRQSGQPLQTFARMHGLVPQRLRRWRDIFVADDQPVTLVPMVVTEAASVWATAHAPVIVHAGRACTVEVADPAQVSPHWVAALVVALGTSS